MMFWNTFDIIFSFPRDFGGIPFRAKKSEHFDQNTANWLNKQNPCQRWAGILYAHCAEGTLSYIIYIICIFQII